MKIKSFIQNENDTENKTTSSNNPQQVVLSYYYSTKSYNLLLLPRKKVTSLYDEDNNFDMAAIQQQTTTMANTATIGASLLNFIHNNNNNDTSDNRQIRHNHRENDVPRSGEGGGGRTQQQQTTTTTTTTTSDIPVNPCLLLYTHNNNKNSRKRSHRRIAVCGPSRSCNSSLAMELAYSAARSAAPCLCFDPRMCRCIAVTIYRPAALQSADDEEDNFPLYCRQIINTRTRIATNAQDCDIDQQSQHVDKRQRTNKQQQQQQQQQKEERLQDDSNDYWDLQILKRIRVQRVGSVRELMHDLLTLCGKPLQEQPRPGGAIIIDDIDTIVARGSTTTTMTTNNDPSGTGNGGASLSWQATSGAILQTGTYRSTFLVIYLLLFPSTRPYFFFGFGWYSILFIAVALASDTATALERSFGPSGQPITVLVTTKDSRMIFPSSIGTTIFLRQQKQKQEILNDRHNDECQEWKVRSDDDDCNTSTIDNKNSKTEMDNMTTNNNKSLTIQSRWYAEIRPTTSWDSGICSDEGEEEAEEEDDSPSFVEYVVVHKTNNDESEIRWKIPS
jgi:hypothetical protein